MSADGKQKYLTESLNQQLEAFSNRRKQNKSKAFWFKMLVTSFNVATTILLGLQGLEGVKFVNATIFVKTQLLY